MIAATRVESGPKSPAYDYIARVLHGLMPLVERGNIATEVEIAMRWLIACGRMMSPMNV
jgi:hypothetical protein